MHPELKEIEIDDFAIIDEDDDEEDEYEYDDALQCFQKPLNRSRC